MSMYKPTMHLRFIEREVKEASPVYGGGTVARKVKVLQQFVVISGKPAPHEFETMPGEWRDVPLMKE